MKTALLLLVALFAVSSAQAQIFGPHRRQARPTRSDGQFNRHTPSVSVGYRGGSNHISYRSHSHHAYRSLRAGYYPAYGYGYYPYASYRSYPYSNYGYSYPSYGYSFPNYGYYGSGYYSPGYQVSGSAAASGLWLGALAGGIIGHNSGEFRHNGWRGAAWGAGLGWLLGAAVDANRRVGYGYQTPMTVPQAPVTQGYAAPQQAQPVTIINNYYNAPATPMSAANGLFGRN